MSSPGTPRLPQRRPTAMLAGVALMAFVLVGCTAAPGSSPAGTGPAEPATSTAPAEPATSTAPAEPAASTAPAASGGAEGTICQDIAALEAAVTALSQVDIRSGGREALLAAVDDVVAAAQAVRASASDDVATAVDTFQGEVENLKTAAEALGEGDTVSAIAALVQSISTLAGSAQTMEAELRAACP